MNLKEKSLKFIFKKEYMMNRVLFVLLFLFLVITNLSLAQEFVEPMPLSPEEKAELIRTQMFDRIKEAQSAQEEILTPSFDNDQVTPGVQVLAPVAVDTSNAAKISLDIKGMDIVDVCKMLALRAGLNIVVGKNVKGKVSLFLRDVDIWDAFEIILLANGLAYDRKDNIVNIMTQKDYQVLYGVAYKDKKDVDIVRLRYSKAKDLVGPLGEVKSSIGKVVVDDVSNSLILIDTLDYIERMKRVIAKTDLPTQTKIFSLNYAEADTLKANLEGLVTQGIGLLEIDERTNKIAVTDTPQKLREIEKIILAFDERPMQVLIDAQIIELSPSYEFAMGIDWDYWIEKHFRISAPFAGVADTTKISIGTVGSTVSEVGNYKAVIDALQTLGDIKILSSPRIMVIEGQEANILVGTKEAYLTSSTTEIGDSASSTETVNFVDVGIKLYVTPRVSHEGFITMQIKPEVSSSELVNFGTATDPKQIPIVTTSEAETTVLVKDGTTIIIGGLSKDSKTKTVKKIPLLGDIPGLGFLFRSISDAAQKTELVILLTPHVISGEHSITDFSQIKPKDGVVVEMFEGNIIKERITPTPDSQ